MIRQELHLHTTFCDGKNTPEELVQAALAKGLTRLGFSGHGYSEIDTEFCMSREGELAYRAEIARLQTVYGDRIEILRGVEQDYFSGKPLYEYDYVIGSVHSVKAGEVFLPVDKSAESFKAAVETHFGGDYLAFAEEYYRLVGDVVAQTGATIVGHFDLVTKFNEGGKLFDESDPRYVAAWQAAADKLLATGATFEVNTGAIARGYRTHPYPSAPILNYLKAHGAPLILTGDAHSADTLCFAFDAWQHLTESSFQLCRRCGTRSPATSQFCGRCGASFAAATAPDGSPAAVWQLRKLASSGLFLAALILLTISAAVGFLTDGLPLVFSSADPLNLLEYGIIPTWLLWPLSAAAVACQQVIEWLILGGLWAVFASARRRSAPLSLKGLSVVRAGMTVSLVYVLVACVLLAAGAIAELVMLPATPVGIPWDLGIGLDPSITAYVYELSLMVLITVLVVAVAIAVLYSIVFARSLSSMKAARTVLATGCPTTEGISVFVAVMAFLYAVGPTMEDPLCAIATVFFGVVLLQFRHKMKQAEYPKEGLS